MIVVEKTIVIHFERTVVAACGVEQYAEAAEPGVGGGQVPLHFLYLGKSALFGNESALFS